ncbi:imelysin family protein [Rhodocaloribacter litoris]|uniref:imelysin family protein n=1 Tax=Rhodocaloribacter litoris TaxID=2558931 RepID=UPI001423CBEE|nr:imelysin family protein [Rhodocaloribacter litoris]QXD16124.1 imelysin family protein [Rhodocaloribacter litoris]
MNIRPHPFPFVLAGILLLASCDSSPSTSEPPPDATFDRSAMLENYGRTIILPAYETLKQAVDALQAAATTFAGNPTASNLAALRERLKAARLAWQDAALFQFGPAESVTLRATLNTYPADEAKIEANIASGNYVLGTIDNRAAVGFPALAYLLYGPGSTDEEILAAYTNDAQASGRMTYLQDNVTFIKAATDATFEAWHADGGNYIGTFLSPEKAGTDVGSALGMLVNAFILHYERFIRDGKIGIPAGVRSAGVPRPGSTEAFYGGYSAELAVAGVRATRRLFLGNSRSGAEGPGLDDNLRFLGAETLADQITTELDEAIAALEALQDPLSTQIESDLEPVLTAFTELQDVVVLLKADMTSVLGITITFQDNDGD